MIPEITTADACELISKRFASSGIPLDELIAQEYPEETVFVAHVRDAFLTTAAELGNALDEELQGKGFHGFVTVRRTQEPKATPSRVSTRTAVADERAADLIALITSRARTSETQPSLRYVVDAAANLARVRARRHSLIFGRRGAGKTALMLEAKRQVVDDGQIAVWLNLQTYRRESVHRAALWIAARICDAILTALRDDRRRQLIHATASSTRSHIETLLGATTVDVDQVHRLIPSLQTLIQRFCETSGRRLYVFLDDVHYLQRPQQPELLDLLHGCVRDADAWLKIAAIRHFAKWYQINPPTGLQAGQDADAIDLDLSLQQPTRAKQFLEQVLAGFASHVGVSAIAGLYAADALDRLVLASGAVPRDYLVLAGGALSHARPRGKSRLVGKQDVARAAGDIAQAKMSELEEDSTAATGSAQRMIAGLQILRQFCLSDKKYSFFQIDFRDKEKFVEEYSLLQSLMDVRLIHMVNASVSDTHRSGERAELYMLDLSQFSGERLRRHLKVLDFVDGDIVLRETGTTRKPRRGDTPRKLITMLRSAPRFDLAQLSGVAAPQ